ncbi:pectinesterase family protein [Actinoplanes sp. HUAS TT8]|uniref:pectinesterase family protein n=1 Tax=Actinoplanes sp. HUAS TT8 TaxID=3447453 RepID=UPI003F5265BC
MIAKLVAVALLLPPAPAATDAPVTWTDRPIGFAAVAGPDGHATTGGAAGPTVRAQTLDQLRSYAAATEPLVVTVAGSIRVDPFGDMITVASDKTIIGAGPGAELVGGGLFLNGTHNVIIRNLTIRDSYIPGDFDGKRADNDNDGIRLDTAHHVWIDHTRIERVGDGGIDIRKDSDYITLSWNVISDINKALGVGWTANVITRLTAHHNWIRNTVQRNWSLDNTAAAHLFDNYLQDITQYGTMSRNNARVLVEDSVFDHVNDPLVVKDATASLTGRRNLFTASPGRNDRAGVPFDPATFYPYSPDPASRVRDLVTRYAGPAPTVHRTPRAITVALDGTGDYGSLLAALGATRDARGPVTIALAPGFYREQVRIWPDQAGVTVTGPADAIVAYDLDPAAQKFYGGLLGADAATVTLLGSGTTLRGLTIDATTAPALRSAGDRSLLDGTRLTGPLRAERGRTYLRDCAVEAENDLITGPAVAVLDGCALTTGTGAVTAADTPATQRYGILLTHCVITGTGLLGRPGAAGTLAQVVVRESELGPATAAAAWSGDPLPRFAEYADTGPGAVTGPGRPQLSPRQAGRYTVDAYLGHDWRPRI